MSYLVNIFDIASAAHHLKDNNPHYMLDTFEDVKVKIIDMIEEVIEDDADSLCQYGVCVTKEKDVIRVMVVPQFSSTYFVEAQGLDF